MKGFEKDSNKIFSLIKIVYMCVMIIRSLQLIQGQDNLKLLEFSGQELRQVQKKIIES